MLEKPGNYFFLITYLTGTFIKEHARIFEKNLERSIWNKLEKTRIT